MQKRRGDITQRIGPDGDGEDEVVLAGLGEVCVGDAALQLLGLQRAGGGGGLRSELLPSGHLWQHAVRRSRFGDTEGERVGEGDGELNSFLSFAPIPVFVLVVVRNEGTVVRDVFVEGAREKTVDGVREAVTVVAVAEWW